MNALLLLCIAVSWAADSSAPFSSFATRKPDDISALKTADEALFHALQNRSNLVKQIQYFLKEAIDDAKPLKDEDEALQALQDLADLHPLPAKITEALTKLADESSEVSKTPVLLTHAFKSAISTLVDHVATNPAPKVPFALHSLMIEL